MKVLIPSDNRDFVSELIAAYQHAGYEVVTGTLNFDLGAGQYDLVHYQWPEELCDWQPPSQQRLTQIAAKLDWWESRCPTIVTAHNFYPHGFEGNQAYKELYEMFYARCSCVQHFSAVSKKLVCDEFAGAQHDRHIVTTPWNFSRTLGAQTKRGSCRGEFGIGSDEFVALVMGGVRSWAEIQLICKAFSSCGVPKKRLLMAGRYSERSGRWLRRWRRTRWRLWLWRHKAVVEERFVPDEDLYRFLDTADVVLVPRVGDLSSGIPSLAMTFGTMVIAPSHGAFPEYLAGTGNILYESGNPDSLARAMEKAAALDRQRVGAENRQKAEQWTWDKIVGDCLHALDKRRTKQ